MQWLEKKLITIRHSKKLVFLGWFWVFVRPIYDFTLAFFFRNGLKRVFNEQDILLVAPECRGVRENYEPDVWTHMMSRAKSGQRIADVGAYIGLYATALGKRIGKSGKVFAFDADYATFQILKKNIRLNRLEMVVEAHFVAVSDQSGEVVFQTGIGPESRLSYGENTSSRGVSTRIKSTTLDEFFYEDSLDLLKIDVEGFEQQVLLGGRQLLSDSKRAPRYIYVEVHPFAWAQTKTTSETLLKLLHGFGYAVYFLDGRRVEIIKEYGEIYCVR